MQWLVTAPGGFEQRSVTVWSLIFAFVPSSDKIILIKTYFDISLLN